MNLLNRKLISIGGIVRWARLRVRLNRVIISDGVNSTRRSDHDCRRLTRERRPSTTIFGAYSPPSHAP